MASKLPAFSPDPEFVFPYPLPRDEGSLKTAFEVKAAFTLLSGESQEDKKKTLLFSWGLLTMVVQPEFKETLLPILPYKSIPLTTTGFAPSFNLQLDVDVFAGLFAAYSPELKALTNLEAVRTFTASNHPIVRNPIFKNYLSHYLIYLTSVTSSTEDTTDEILAKLQRNPRAVYFKAELLTQSKPFNKGAKLVLEHVVPSGNESRSYSPSALIAMDTRTSVKGKYRILSDITIPEMPQQFTAETVANLITKLYQLPTYISAASYEVLTNHLKELGAALKATKDVSTLKAYFNAVYPHFDTANGYIYVTANNLPVFCSTKLASSSGYGYSSGGSVQTASLVPYCTDFNTYHINELALLEDLDKVETLTVKDTAATYWHLARSFSLERDARSGLSRNPSAFPTK